MTETVNDIDLSAASLAKNKLLMDCYRYMQADKLVLPTIPDVSFKIRRAINDDKASSTSIARVVQIDPSITGRLIQISNSPLYRGRKKIESCPEALTRLGLRAAQDIITAFAMKSIFKAKSPVIARKMAELWAHSSYVASISAVFAHRIPGFDPDRAMLAGLIHDVGIVPILTHADNHPDIIANPKDLAETVKQLRVDIGVQIVRRWDFPSDFEDVVINAENWFRKDNQPASYADIVMIAQLHSFIGKVDVKKMPKLDDLPAYQKIAEHLDASDSLDILETARDEIEHIRKMLA
ncbi:MAG: HDOD domain-containing protein [Methylococcaceae bacterium]|jgi:HD-like signal output (HDOD) protein|nr:HDOD domain-containing protein [Methylococcaceae bacterium]MDZ4156425.1 HDOD domain-containing protein [Methylococcales bacterium]MDP2391641.1 HDOD domain-containing protein [Methylococcaceae bacterium]MDP3018140.1 HDOD domain-containing protein [Methylococcaceae bacterium]MDP3389353.1 HDOD domain-containing protein [Methylococcaceae bacterium]